jgi:hypothetical protein
MTDFTHHRKADSTTNCEGNSPEAPVNDPGPSGRQVHVQPVGTAHSQAQIQQQTVLSAYSKNPRKKASDQVPVIIRKANMAPRKENRKKIFYVLKNWMFFSRGLKASAAA